MRRRMQLMCVALIAIVLAVGAAGIGQHRFGSGPVHLVAASGSTLPSSSDDMMKHPGHGGQDLVRGATASSHFPLGAAFAPDLPSVTHLVSRVVWTRPAASSRTCSDSCAARAPPLHS